MLLAVNGFEAITRFLGVKWNIFLLHALDQYHRIERARVKDQEYALLQLLIRGEGKFLACPRAFPLHFALCLHQNIYQSFMNQCEDRACIYGENSCIQLQKYKLQLLSSHPLLLLPGNINHFSSICFSKDALLMLAQLLHGAKARDGQKPA